jgi:hypothetical protein
MPIRQRGWIPFPASFRDLKSTGSRSLANAYTSKGYIRQSKYDTDITTTGIQRKNRHVVSHCRVPYSRAFLEKRTAAQTASRNYHFGEPKFNFRVHRIIPLDTEQTTTPYLFKINLNTIFRVPHDITRYIFYFFTYFRHIVHISIMCMGICISRINIMNDKTYLTIHTVYVSTLICPLKWTKNLWYTFSHM